MNTKKRLLNEEFSFYDYAMHKMNGVFSQDENTNFEIDVFWCRYIRHTVSSAMEGRHKIHSHSFFELHCVLDGEYIYSDNSKNTIKLKPGEFILIPPNIKHNTTNTKQSSEVFALTFEPIETDNPQVLKLIAALNSSATVSGELPKDVITLIELIMKELYHGQIMYAQNIKALLNIIVIRITRELFQNETWLTEQSTRRRGTDHRITVLENYMLENPSACFTVSDLTEYVNLSEKQLNNIVRKELGISAKAFIDRVKISCARRMLLETDLSISEISDKLGFTDNNNFNRFFKRVEGIAPGLFRQSKGK